MCGIAGFNGRYSPDLLKHMGQSISTRGPDDFGEFYDEENRIGFCHRRLSIIDLSSSGHQPMWDYGKQACIVFNGEIFNFKALRKQLVRKGFIFRSGSDTEVLLNLYLNDGFDMLSKLNGMFSFAIWDDRKKILFVARDQVGIKPFYFSESSAGFIFGSELKAILQEPSVKRDLDYQSISDHLTYLWCPGKGTVLKSVRKLEPGHALIVRAGSIEKMWSYYEIPYSNSVTSIGETEAITQLQAQLKRSVKSQLVSDVPVGAFLSGGLDSSSIIALAKDQCPDTNIECFTINTNEELLSREGFVGDLSYARKVAGHLKVNLNEISVGPEIVDDLAKMLFHLDEPQADPAPLNAMYICELAKRNGIKVLLSGAGGDDLFTGYRRHYALMQERYWSWMPRVLRASLRVGSSRFSKQNSLMRRAAKAFQYADLDEQARLVGYFKWMPANYTNMLFSKQASNELRGYSSSSPLLGSLAKLPNNVHPLNKMLFLEKKHFLADHNLNYTDKMGMAMGVEARVPLLDIELIDFVSSLPVNLKQRGTVGKYIFKKAMEPYLPKDVIYRPKTGFGAPLRYWLGHNLKEQMNDLLSKKSIENRGVFDPKSVEYILKLDKEGKQDLSYPIFSLMCIEMWCRIFIDKPIPSY